MPFDSFRAFKNQVREDLEPYRSVDGELIERFLDLDEEAQQGVVMALSRVDEQQRQGGVVGGVDQGKGQGKKKEITLEGLRALVEGLKRFR